MKKHARDRNKICRCGGNRWKTVSKKDGQYRCRSCAEVVIDPKKAV